MMKILKCILVAAAFLVCVNAGAEDSLILDLHSNVRDLGIQNAVEGTNIFVFRIYDKKKVIWDSEPIPVDVVKGEFVVRLGDPAGCVPPLPQSMFERLDFTLCVDCGRTANDLHTSSKQRQLGAVFLAASEPKPVQPTFPESYQKIRAGQLGLKSAKPTASNVSETNGATISNNDLATTKIEEGRTFSVLSRSAPLTVYPVLQVGTNPNVPHYSYATAATVFKAVASGGTPPYSYQWDVDGNGSFDSGVLSSPNNYDLPFTYSFPSSPIDRNLTATVKVTDNLGAQVTAAYKLKVYAEANVTDAIKADKAVDDSLWFMHRNMVRSSSGGQPTAHLGTTYFVASTGIAIQTFQNKGNRVFGDTSNPYVVDVIQMHNYVFSVLTSVAISTQPAGNPDVNGNGIGICFDPGGSDQIYATGILLVAIGTSGTQTRLVPTGLPFAGRSYQSVCQDMVDYFAWGQMEAGPYNGRGSWRYYPNQLNDYQDGSQNHFVATGLLWAEQIMGCTVPQFVKDELKIAFASSQAANGGISYQSPAIGWLNVGKTGGNLSTLALINDSTFTTSRIALSKTYIADHWVSGGDSSPLNIGHAYGMYGVMKGARSYTPHITTFKTSGGVDIDWYNEYRTYILAHQNADGSYNGFDTSWMDGDAHMRTAVDTEILQLTFLTSPPVAVATADSTDAPPFTNVNLRHNQSYLLDTAHPIIEYAWDFGNDGNFDFTTSDPLAVASMPLGNVGTYTALLRVTDDIGQTGTDLITITASSTDHPPVAFAIPTGQSAATADYILDVSIGSVLLNGTASTDPDVGDSIAESLWDIDGDANFTGALPDLSGATASLTNANKPSAWNINNTYNVTLRVKDMSGLYGYSNASVLYVADSKPIPNNQTVTTNEDTAKPITLTATNLRTALTLTVTAIPLPAQGVLYQTVDGSTPTTPISANDAVTNSSQKVVFVPALNVNGLSLTTFSFSAFDGVKTSTTDGVVTLNVTAVNDPPVAVNDTVSVGRNSGANTINVLANDSDIETPNVSLTVSAITQGAHGAVINNGTNVSYQPAFNYSGPDSFTYTVNDGNGGTAVGTVNVTVNSAPVPNAGGPYVIGEGSSLPLNGTGTMDADGDTLTYSWDVNGDNVLGDATGSAPTLTWAQLNALGIANGPYGPVTVTLQVSDGIATVTATTTLIVNNTAPTVTAINILNAGVIHYGDTVSVSGNFTDPALAGDANFTYAWSVTRLDNSVVNVTGASGTILAASYGTVPSASFVADKAETFTVRLDVTDKDTGTHFITAPVVIAPKPITVTMNALTTQIYGQPADTYHSTWNKTFVTPSGLTLGDDIDDLTPASLTFTPTPAFSTPFILTPIGVYSVLPGGLSNPNYSITYVPSLWTITREGRPRRSLGN